MNAKQLIVSLSLLGATGAVFAQAVDYEVPNAHFVSTKTRAEVVAELKQAQATGNFVAGGEAYSNERLAVAKTAAPQVAPAPVAGKTRAEVVAELAAAKADGSFVTGGYEYIDQSPMMAKSLRNAGEGIESATNSKSASKANGG